MKHNIERSVDTGDQALTVHMKNSPNATKIATSGDALKIWDANTGELLKTLKFALSLYLTWSHRETLVCLQRITKFDTATWPNNGSWAT
jgi:hypothetical protein